MGLYTELSKDLGEVDVIVSGGGSAGCVVASRLAEADPNLSILLIESGQSKYEDPTIVTPGMYGLHLARETKTCDFHESKPSDKLAGRSVVVTTGATLGGGSAINFTMYTRGQRDDYDSWETPGWSTDELFPFVKKLETYHNSTDAAHHGFEGPMQISDGTYRVKRVEDAILKAAGVVGWSEIEDLQTLEHNNGFQRWKRYVTLEGKRADAAHMYLHPLLNDGKHPNLHVLVESQVSRVLFDESKRACGVEYRTNPRFQPKDAPASQKHTVRARKLVILSSGACGTPGVLERSGIGAADVLEKASVPLISELPGVGHDYQDHQGIFMPFKTSLEPHETGDELLQGRLSFEEAAKRNDPRLGWNYIDIAGKCRPTEEDVAALGPEFKAVWDRDYRDKPNRPIMLMAAISAAFIPKGFKNLEHGQYMTWVNYTAYPYSRGHLHITGPELDDPLDFNAGYYGDANDIDMKKHLWAYKRAREIIRRLPMFRGEIASEHPAFATDSKAACTIVGDDYDISAVKNLEYSAEDDKAIEQFLRENVETTWHSLGTAKMAPREDLGVVDKDLNVYGVTGLKLADLSIAPKNVGANTCNTALLIGEKAADIFIRELGLCKE
ncbi:GMC oxidoreductase [Xylaria nigripes]|nr:GMC oxidoreductase [Xylaria nigripes]